MSVLTCPLKLSALRTLLTRSFPESLKAYGALQHVLTGNAFKLEVLVDQWPDFSTVICRPSLQAMKDPSDHYRNTYYIFTKDPHNLQKMLEDPQVVNWNQDTQIEAFQPELGIVLQKVSSKHGRQMETIGGFLLTRDKLTDEELAKFNRSSNEFYYTPLLVSEAPVVNNQLVCGQKKQQSLCFIERCIQDLPNICVRKKGLDQPIGWLLPDCSMEYRTIYMSPAYKRLGLAHNMFLKFCAANQGKVDLYYACLKPDNVPIQCMCLKIGFRFIGTWMEFYFTQKSKISIQTNKILL
ncbi:glycine N-acyltransferase-like protein 1 [Aquarana catesbeiana]|uniref:glycine N-acyltransferase-like protein 1 n=1 Tax=Aquarana catesbeiana TaxID=8400 RepID=UPI003CC94DDF